MVLSERWALRAASFEGLLTTTLPQFLHWLGVVALLSVYYRSVSSKPLSLWGSNSGWSNYA